MTRKELNFNLGGTTSLLFFPSVKCSLSFIRHVGIVRVAYLVELSSGILELLIVFKKLSQEKITRQIKRFSQYRDKMVFTSTNEMKK